MRDRIEEVPGVLDAALKGVRDDLVEVIVDPVKLSSYGLQLDQLIAGVGANNSLVAAGSLEGAEGRYAIKIPSLIETADDVANLPVVAGPDAVVRARDIATVRATFKDPETITRLNGQPAIAIEVSKRTGANLIETVDGVKAAAEAAGAVMPEGAVLGFCQDKSTDIRQLLSDLQNSVLTAVVLVFIVILFALSGRAAILIGLAIPVSFLIGILLLSLAGLTVNIVVLFSLILAVGMLVDDAIIVTEFAERRMAEGMPREEAFALAAQAHGGAGDRRDADAGRGLLAAAVLAGDRRRVHEVHADHADRDAVGVDALCAGVHADARRAFRQAGAAPARRATASIWRWSGGRCGIRSWCCSRRSRSWSRCRWPTAAMAPGWSSSPTSSRTTACSTSTRAATSRSRRRTRWCGRPRRASSAGRASSRSIPGSAAALGRKAATSTRMSSESSSTNSSTGASATAPTPSSTELREAMTGIPGADVEVSVPNAGPPTGKAIQVQLSAVDPAGLNDVARSVADKLRAMPDVIDVSDGLPRARRRLGARGRPRARGAVRRLDRGGRQRGAAGDQRSEARRLPARRGRRYRRYPAAAAGGPPHLRDARRAAHRDRVGVDPDRQLRLAQPDADHRHPDPDRRRSARSPCRPASAPGCRPTRCARR